MLPTSFGPNMWCAADHGQEFYELSGGEESLTGPLTGGVCVFELDCCHASALGATLFIRGLKADVGGGKPCSIAHRSSSPPVQGQSRAYKQL